MYFNLTAAVIIDPAYVAADVLAAVNSALVAYFAFTARDFAQPVTAAETITAIQSVAGVIATDLSQLYRTDDASGSSQTEPDPVLYAAYPQSAERRDCCPPELLLLQSHRLFSFGEDVMSSSTGALYNLLPAIYRIRDAGLGGPLQSLVGICEQLLGILDQDVAGLYENWFIETCAEWVVPYIGDLLQSAPLHSGAAGLTARSYVANTLSYRRRKGTSLALEQLARDVTGWPAVAVEFFQLLATTQYLNHLRLGSVITPDLRNSSALELLDGPFDQASHTVDVRSIVDAPIDPALAPNLAPSDPMIRGMAWRHSEPGAISLAAAELPDDFGHAEGGDWRRSRSLSLPPSRPG